MNKSEKLICLLLACALGWWIFNSVRQQRRNDELAARSASVKAAAGAPAPAPAPAQASAPAQAAEALAPEPARPSEPERLVTLRNGDEEVTLTSWGAAIKSVRLLKYAKEAGAPGADNPPVELDFAESPVLAGGAVRSYGVRDVTEDSATFYADGFTRRISLKGDYVIEVAEESPAGRSEFSLGRMSLGSSRNDILSLDSWDPAEKGGSVRHWGELDPLKGFLAGSAAGGCGGRKSAAGMPPVSKVPVASAQKWVALKNRFFVTALVDSSAPVAGFTAYVRRDARASEYRVESVSATVQVDAAEGARTARLYIGPKKMSLLWRLGMRDVMEFGMWRWVCYPLVWVLNLFYALIPNFGVAIVLLTFLVRIVFWPLTHKSTIGMRRMQEIQPLMKEIQAKYKDNPQRLQQETMALYREHKVNPMSSCLPMLVQIPVFIALFTVLRSAVELRYAPFLWISDLSEPERLFASWFPFGGLNILPVLMAVTMGLQSALTPSAGDRRQQRMMTVMMPAMMLFMFYSFPSALSLYWTLSQVLSIVQMWWIRKRYGAPSGGAGGVEVVEAPVTRQMRRHP